MTLNHPALRIAFIFFAAAVFYSAELLQAQSPGLWPSRDNHSTVAAPAASTESVTIENRSPEPTPLSGQIMSPTVSEIGNYCDQGCVGLCDGSCAQGFKFYCGVDEDTCNRLRREAIWDDAQMIPWEAFAYGEYIGPHRTPHVPQYRVRVNDQVEFVYMITREQSPDAYRLTVGDQLEITSTTDADLNMTDVTILSDGSISLRLIGRVMAARKTIEELQDDLNERYDEFFETDPAIVVRGIKTDTHMLDLIDAVDARFGSGGQSRLTTVSPDGTIQLPMIGSIPAVGLSLQELGREANMRYRHKIRGIEVTPVLVERAPRFIYVVGEVGAPGRVELTGPTSAMQAVALAGGWNVGGNLRQIVVFRRDQNWRLMAIKLDLAGGLLGRRPHPSDEIWLRDSDIVLVPKMPILRVADAIDLYFTRSLYGVIPLSFNADTFNGLGF